MSRKTIEFSLEGKDSKPNVKPRAKESDERKRRSNLMNKIKAYQKHNDIEVNTTVEDFDSDFNDSLQFLDNLSKTRKRKNANARRKTQRANEPQYGNLKNGIKPTFRQLEKQPVVVQPKEAVARQAAAGQAAAGQAIAGQAAAGQAVARQAVAVYPEDTMALHSPLYPIQVVAPSVKTSPIVTAPIVPTTKHTIAKRPKTTKYHLGKQKKKVSVLIKNRKTRKRIENEDKKLVEKDIAEMRSHLIERNLYKAGSAAPSDVIRQLYRQSILAGDISNKNGDTLLHNYVS